jgi:hypothetical protein
MNEKKSVDKPSLPSVARIFPNKPKEMNIKEMKMIYTHAVIDFIIDKCQPFNIVESPGFSNLFCTFHKDSEQITNVSRNRVREEIFSLGSLAIKATQLEVGKHKGLWTTDHWTGCDDATYNTTTFHYIKDHWSLLCVIVDFKVFHGTTSGEAIYNDQVKVLEGYTTRSNAVIGITDTTGSMGVLGQYLHNNGMQHAYCTDHVLHCNAILAFNSEYQTALNNQFLADCLPNIFCAVLYR